MKITKCHNCGQKKNCHDSWAAWIFFIIGLISTVAVRIVTVLMEVNPLYGKIAWYLGVAGFLVFFVYKFLVNRALAKTIEKENLLEKTKTEQPLSSNDYGVLAAILCSLKSEKERINYFFIFAVSAVAFILAVYFDFVR